VFEVKDTYRSGQVHFNYEQVPNPFAVFNIIFNLLSSGSGICGLDTVTDMYAPNVDKKFPCVNILVFV